MNRYAVIELQNAPAELPEHDVMWQFEKNGILHVGLEYGSDSELPALTGWTVLTGSIEFNDWLYS